MLRFNSGPPEIGGRHLRWATVAVVASLGASGVGCEPERRGAKDRAAPVGVAPIARGAIALARTYSGTLEAPARFVVAPKTGGRVERLAVDLGDPVRRGQRVATLDDDEVRQALAQAQAERKVAAAQLTQARSALAIAERDLTRVRQLRQRGVSSAAQLDAAEATKQARAAELEVARAQVARTKAMADAARIRLGYTEVRARWTEGDDERVVAERFVSEGALVAENAPLLSIVELNPLRCVIFVAEKDYGGFEVGLVARLVTDAYPGETFEARVARIAPVFDPGSRQARVELSVANDDGRLRPGMFVRASVTLETVADAAIVPFAAVANRAGESGVFVVDAEGTSVRWQPVELGIRDGERVQLIGGPVVGRVVILGQQLLDDGASISIPDDTPGTMPKATP